MIELASSVAPQIFSLEAAVFYIVLTSSVRMKDANL
jgi:hypothetical protein